MFAVGGRAGNIGNEILRRFKVTFDYSRAQMILEPNNAIDQPDEFDMSGLSPLAEESDLRVYGQGYRGFACQRGRDSGRRLDNRA